MTKTITDKATEGMTDAQRMEWIQTHNTVTGAPLPDANPTLAHTKARKTTKPQDLITNILQEQIDDAAKLLKRSDLAVCIQLTPGKRPRYAIRLGEHPWIKDIDLPDTLTMICEDSAVAAKQAQTLAQEADDARRILEVYRHMMLWKETPASEPPF